MQMSVFLLVVQCTCTYIDFAYIVIREGGYPNNPNNPMVWRDRIRYSTSLVFLQVILCFLSSVYFQNFSQPNDNLKRFCINGFFALTKMTLDVTVPKFQFKNWSSVYKFESSYLMSPSKICTALKIEYVDRYDKTKNKEFLHIKERWVLAFVL